MAGSQTVAFDLTCPDAAMIEARLQLEDTLKADNAARICLPPAKQSAVLLVTTGNLFLEKVLSGLPCVIPGRQTGRLCQGLCRNHDDVIIFDRWAPEKLSKGNFVFFGCVRRRRKVTPRCRSMMKPTSSISTACTPSCTRLHRRDPGRQVEPHQSTQGCRRPPRNQRRPRNLVRLRAAAAGGVVSFNLGNSVWPLQVGFPVFMYNTIRYLTGSAMQADRSLQPGQTSTSLSPPTSRRSISRRPIISTARSPSRPEARAVPGHRADRPVSRRTRERRPEPAGLRRKPRGRQRVRHLAAPVLAIGEEAVTTLRQPPGRKPAPLAVRHPRRPRHPLPRMVHLQPPRNGVTAGAGVARGSRTATLYLSGQHDPQAEYPQRDPAQQACGTHEDSGRPRRQTEAVSESHQSR